MAKIALIFFLFALFAVCMCARVTREDAPNQLQVQIDELVAKAKQFFSEDSFKDFQKKAEEAASEGFAAFQKLSSNLNEKIQSTKP